MPNSRLQAIAALLGTRSPEACLARVQYIRKQAQLQAEAQSNAFMDGDGTVVLILLRFEPWPAFLACLSEQHAKYIRYIQLCIQSTPRRRCRHVSARSAADSLCCVVAFGACHPVFACHARSHCLHQASTPTGSRARTMSSPGRHGNFDIICRFPRAFISSPPPRTRLCAIPYLVIMLIGLTIGG